MKVIQNDPEAEAAAPQPVVMLSLRIELAQLHRVDAWRRRADDLPSRSEAVRQILEIGLAGDERKAYRARPRGRVKS